MKTNDIVLHMMEWLPKYTDSFTDYFNPDSVSVSGTTVTVNKVAHGLTGNDKLISVTDSVIANSISNIDDSGSDVVFTTASPHDVTLQTDYVQATNNQVYLMSATQPSVDGLYTLNTVTDRNTFSIASFPNTALTNVKLLETRDNSIDGLFVANVLTVDSFTYTLPSALAFDPTILASSTKVHYSLRIRGASSVERVIANYNQSAPSDLWGYIVLGDVVTNKSRYAETDSDMEMGGGNAWNALLRSPFTFYAFVPELETNDGLVSRDTAEDVRPHIYKTLCGASFSTGFANEADAVTSPRGDGVYISNLSAFYIHQYTFEQIAQVEQSDTLYDAKTVAFDSIQFDYLNVVNDNGKVIVTTIASLDE